MGTVNIYFCSTLKGLSLFRVLLSFLLAPLVRFLAVLSSDMYPELSGGAISSSRSGDVAEAVLRSTSREGPDCTLEDAMLHWYPNYS